MEKNSKSNFISILSEAARKKLIPERSRLHLEQFYSSYKASLESHGLTIAPCEHLFATFLHLMEHQLKEPYVFPPYHKKIRAPFDYYAFGNDFLRPLIDMEHSSLEGLLHADEIHAHISRGHNVVLLANHQTEADPQAISLLLEKTHPLLAEEMIFVAGERVITDPVAIPFSMGRNLLCIYSKRYIDHPPEDKMKKQLHNKKTMELMKELLSEGGHCIYVAPSGGRDRPNEQGIVEIAPFDSQSIEMFYLMARRADHPTFFYPLTLMTYDLLPPPENVQIELGETRMTKRGAIHMAFGPQLDMEHFPGSDEDDKHQRRKNRADFICSLVKESYAQMLSREDYT
jgi:glycerol-3-phosphate O-acyltransferase